MDTTLAMISSYLIKAFPKEIVFYYRKGRFLIFGDLNMDSDAVIKNLIERFKDPWNALDTEVYLEAGFTKLELKGRVRSAEDIISTMVSAFERADNNTRSIQEITTDDIDEIEAVKSIKRTLESVIEKNEVEVFLQPLIDVKTGKIAGAEALARIRDKDGIIIPPGLFIPVAESNGRINKLGEQVFEKTCIFIKNNDLEKVGVKWINVNLSPVQFMRKDLADRYDRIIRKYDINPDKIHLEITEESMVDEQLLERQIKHMENKGFKFVLDDYGKGYSNLSRLKNCPFINVKLDMGIVWDYYKEHDDILPTMITAFKHMKFGVTAEGIEDENMAEDMKNAGCDFLQGFFYSKPLPMDEFLKKYGSL